MRLQVPRSTVQTAVCKYQVHGTAVSLPPSGRKLNHLLQRENWS